MEGWLDLFATCLGKGMYDPLSQKVLRNLKNPITKQLLKAYTSESMSLYQEINQIMRDKNQWNDKN